MQLTYVLNMKEDIFSLELKNGFCRRKYQSPFIVQLQLNVCRTCDSLTLSSGTCSESAWS